jgi:hypothetical protein
VEHAIASFGKKEVLSHTPQFVVGFMVTVRVVTHLGISCPVQCALCI